MFTNFNLTRIGSVVVFGIRFFVVCFCNLIIYLTMVMSCSATGCSNRYKNKNFSFHSFPKNQNILNKWLAAIRRKNFIPGAYAKICSNHFHPTDFVHNFGRKTLKTDAVPSIFEFSKPSIKKPMKLRSGRADNSFNEGGTSFPSTSGSVVDSNHDISKCNIKNEEETAVERAVVLSSSYPETNILAGRRPSTSGSVVDNNQEISTCNIVIVEEITAEKADVLLSSSPETNVLTGRRPSTKGSVVDSKYDNSKCNIVIAEEIAAEKANVPPEAIILTAKRPSISGNVVDNNHNISKCNIVIIDETAVEKADVLLSTAPGTNILAGGSPSTSGSVVNSNHDIISKFNKEFVEDTGIELLSTSPGTNISTGKRKRSVPAFMGDIDPSDLENVKKFKIMWHIAKQKIERQTKKIKYLQTTLRRANHKISTLEDLVYDLFESII